MNNNPNGSFNRTINQINPQLGRPNNQQILQAIQQQQAPNETHTPVRPGVMQDMQNPNMPAVVTSQPNIGTNSCNIYQRFRNLSKKKQVCISISGVITIIAIALTIILPIILTRKVEISSNVERGLVLYQGKYVEMTFRQKQTKDGEKKHDINIYGVHKKEVQVIHMNTQSTIKLLGVEEKNTFYTFLIPIFSILQKFGIQHKNKTPFKEWLQYFNSHTRELIDNLLETISSQFSKSGSFKDGVQITSKIKAQFVNATETVWPVVEYNPFTETFNVVTLTNTEDITAVNKTEVAAKQEAKTNLKTEANTEANAENTQQVKNEVTTTTQETQQASQKYELITQDTSKLNTEKPTTQKVQSPKTQQQLLAEVMKNTVHYIKRVAERNIETYKQNSEQVKKLHKELVASEEIDEQWQEALLSCGIINSLTYKCPMKVVQKLVPGMTEQKLMDKNGNYLLIYGLNIVLKQVIEQATL